MALASLDWPWWLLCFVLAAVATLWVEPLKGRIGGIWVPAADAEYDGVAHA
jgi:hypothetical protein